MNRKSNEISINYVTVTNYNQHICRINRNSGIEELKNIFTPKDNIKLVDPAVEQTSSIEPT